MDIKDLVLTLKIVSYVSSASVLIPFIVGIVCYRTFNTYLKVLFFYTCAALAAETVLLYYSFRGENNLFFSYIITTIEFSAFIYLYCTVLKLEPKNFILILLISCYTLFVGANVLLFNDYDKLGAFSKNTEATILIVFSILYFYRIMVRAEHANILALPAFWINAGALVYFSGNFFLILFSNYLNNTSDMSYLVFYTIHSVFNITFNSCIAIGFYKQKKHDR